jgi:membrane protein DedA with SNARE-associated domain
VHLIEAWMATLPAILVYLLVGLVIGVESMGVPLPGEIALITASLLAATSHLINPWWVAVAATIGAIAGDSIGYAVGRRGGPRGTSGRSILLAQSTRFNVGACGRYFLAGSWRCCVCSPGRSPGR